MDHIFQPTIDISKQLLHNHDIKFDNQNQNNHRQQDNKNLKKYFLYPMSIVSAIAISQIIVIVHYAEQHHSTLTDQTVHKIQIVTRTLQVRLRFQDQKNIGTQNSHNTDPSSRHLDELVKPKKHDQYFQVYLDYFPVVFFFPIFHIDEPIHRQIVVSIKLSPYFVQNQ